MRRYRRLRPGAPGLLGLALAATAGGGACRTQDMVDQPRYEALERSAFFADRRSARMPVEGTVARGALRVDRAMFAGKTGDRLVDGFPFSIGLAELRRGRERYDIYCAPCHGLLGTGDGMIVQRGLRPPPSFLVDRLREAPTGHFFDVITNGFGAMYSYASRVPARDRWLIIAYVRALQLGGGVAAAELPAEDRRRLEGAR